jgi:hypothetical protein
MKVLALGLRRWQCAICSNQCIRSEKLNPGQLVNIFAISSGLQVVEIGTTLALRIFIPLAVAAAAALCLSQRYVDAIAITAICAMGPISEQVALDLYY